MSISAEKLTDEIMRELEQYSDEVATGMKVSIDDVSKTCLSEIRKASPKRTGAYKKGWVRKKIYESQGGIKYVIYNKSHYQLTHLLEHGHAKRSGGRVGGKPHISPAETRAKKALIIKIKEVIGQ